MIYFEFVKNFLLADSYEQMPVRLISTSWAQIRFIPTFWTWCTSCSWKILFAPIAARRCLLDSLRPPEPKNVWFLLSRHDVFGVHEKFSSSRFRRADACKTDFDLLRAKTFCSYFLDMMYVEFKKNFLVADSGEQMPVDSLRPPEPKNVWFLLSRHDVLRVHEKFSSRRFRRADACQDSLRPPEPKNVWFLLSRHDVLRVHEKFSSRRFRRADAG